MMARPILEIQTSPEFERAFVRLLMRIQKLARRKDSMFRQDAFHPSLDTHKLHGELKGTWAYSVNKHYRVHFYFVDDHTVVYVNIGTHEIYK